MKGNETYNSLAHTSKITLRTYVQVITPTASKLKGTINSEGAYRIGVCFTRERLILDTCTLNFNGQTFQLMPADLGNGVLAPHLILWLDGNVNTVRDDEFTYEFSTGAVSKLIVLFDRVGKRKDDNIYPAQTMEV